MQVNEIKLVVVGPSLKNWPVPLIIGGLLALTGMLMLLLGFISFKATVLLICLGLAFIAGPVWQASNTQYFITNLRVAVLSGLFSKKQLEIAIPELQDIQITRSPMQDFWGIGSVVLRGPRGILIFEGVEEPESLKEKILSLK
jgi:uncharacterized membrane protein YdbT with pleckstrin-like domain